MKIEMVIILILFASITVASADPIGNEYGFASAWFNGQEATVKNVKLKIGEPIDIKVTVTTNVSGHVFVKLTNPLVTEPYSVSNGPSIIGDSIDNYDVASGWSKTYVWTITPNGAWKNGNTPINVFIQFFNAQKKQSKKLEFTIANPYILDEQYTGSVPTSAQTPATKETITGTTPPKSSPFHSVLLTIAMLLIVRWWRVK